MSKSGRIILALALGGMLGMLVALAAPQIIWWLGPLAGSLIAGFTYALPDIIHHAPVAGRNAWYSLTYTPKVVKMTGKIIVEITRTILFLFGLRSKMSASARLMAAIVWVSLASYGMIIYSTYRQPFVDGPLSIEKLLFIFGAVIYMFFAGILVVRAMFGPFSRKKELTSSEIMAIRKKTLFYISPFGVVFMAGWGIIKIIPPILHVGWESGELIVKFIKTLFILVHSKEIALVGVDTALGVIVTYLLFVRQGDPVIGIGPTLVLSGFVSVLLGYFIDYQIVSRRVLHLNGQKT